MIIIENICKHQQYEEIVVNWLYKEWGHKNSYQFWSDWIKYSKDENSTFQTFVISDNGKLVGTYGIMPIDLQSRQDLTPWIGNLFIDYKYRTNSLKYFSALHEHCNTLCRNLNLTKVYVFTPHSSIVFKRYGFKYFESTVTEEGKKINLLFKTY